MADTPRVTRTILILPLLVLWTLLVIGLARTDAGMLADWGTSGGALTLACESDAEPRIEPGIDAESLQVHVCNTLLPLASGAVRAQPSCAVDTPSSLRLPPARASPRLVV